MPRAQGGVALIVVMGSLLLMSFAAIALLRSSDSTTTFASDLALKSVALASADAGTEEGIDWLKANLSGDALHADQPASGYFSRTVAMCDMTGRRTPRDPADDVNWNGGAAAADCPLVAARLTPAGVQAGYVIDIVIDRACNADGDPGGSMAADGITPMICSRHGRDNAGGSHSGDASDQEPSDPVPTYYRLTTRVTGPRKTVRFVQVHVVAGYGAMHAASVRRLVYRELY